jgi:hypothetical protein
VARESLEISLLHFDSWVTAAVAGALRTIVLNFWGGGAHAINQAEGDERLGKQRWEVLGRVSFRAIEARSLARRHAPARASERLSQSTSGVNRFEQIAFQC